MAEQKGIFPLQGTIRNISFFSRAILFRLVKSLITQRPPPISVALRKNDDATDQ